MAEFVHNGIRYRELPNGQAEVIGPVAGGRIIPKSQTTQRKEGADANSAEADARLKNAEAEYAAQLAAAQARAADAEATLKSAQAVGAITENAAVTPPPTPEVRKARRALQGDNMLAAIQDARRLAGDGYNTGNFFGGPLWSSVPVLGQNASDLSGPVDTLKANLSFDRLQQMRDESKTGGAVGSVTERELGLLGSTVASLKQTQSKEEFLRNLAKIERHYRKSQALLNNEDPENPEVAERYGLAVAAPSAPQQPTGGVGLGGPGEMGGLPQAPAPSGPAPTELTPEGRMVADPALAGANATVTQMIRDGRSEDEIRAYLNRIRPGLGDQTNALGENIRYYNQNPNFTPQVDIEQVWEPASGFNQAMGTAAQWEVPGIGFSPGAAIIGAGDLASFGTLDNFSQNPEMARAVMTGVQQQNPGSFLTGQVAGGILSGLGAEAALGRAGLGQIGRMRGGDLALGAGYGAGSADQPYESRLGGAAVGGLFGLGGGMAGRGAAEGIGRFASGVTDPARRMLADSDVPMTVGQLLGGTAQRVEDRLSGLPFVGDRIMNRRREGVQGFNRAAFDEGLAPINASTGGIVGEQGIDVAQRSVGDAYTQALGGSQVSVDPQFGDDLVTAIDYLRRVPRVGEEVTDSVSQIVNPTYFGAGDTLTGTNMQPMVRELRGLRSAYASDPLGSRVGEGIGQVENAVTGMFERQAPDVMPAYLRANEAFRNEEVLRGAVDKARAGSRSGEPGVFMPSQLLDSAAQNAGKFGNARGTTRQPFFDLARAGQEVLPSKIPDSGTAGRIALPVALMGGGFATSEEGEGVQGAGTGLAAGGALAALLSAPYSRTSRDVIARALLADRSPAARQIGQELIDQSRIAGLLATAPLLAATQ